MIRIPIKLLMLYVSLPNPFLVTTVVSTETEGISKIVSCHKQKERGTLLMWKIPVTSVCEGNSVTLEFFFHFLLCLQNRK